MKPLILILISFLSSCALHHEVSSHGKTSIIINDTTFIDHNGSVFLKTFK